MVIKTIQDSMIRVGVGLLNVGCDESVVCFT